MIALEKKRLRLKPIVIRAVKYVQFTVLFTIILAAGALMGEKGMVQRKKLEEKRVSLERQNEALAKDIKSLEQEVTRLGSDAKTIEKAAARELGMARADETVYIFPRRGRAKVEPPDGE